MMDGKYAYAAVIVLLIAVIGFMVYPQIFIYLVLATTIPLVTGICMEMFYQTDYYKSLDYQTSRLGKTAMISGVVGVTALSFGYFSEYVMDHIGNLFD